MAAGALDIVRAAVGPAYQEFDFYFDGADQEARERVRLALADCALVIDELARSQTVARRGSELVGQGMARYQSYLFSWSGGRSEHPSR